MSQTKQSITEQMFDKLASNKQSAAGGAGSQTTFQGLQQMDKIWNMIKNSDPKNFDPNKAQVVFRQPCKLPVTQSNLNFDVVISGGTLGVILACALQKRGYNVCIIERGQVKGRDQEWNISRKELYTLEEVGIASQEELDSCVNIEFNPIRCGFKTKDVEIMTRDVLNLGVSPEKLIKKLRDRFVSLGGTLLEETATSKVDVFDNFARIKVQQKGDQENYISSRLLIDCMGHASPIVRQFRKGQKPDGICLVVGSCSRGFKVNDYADLIYTYTDAQPKNSDTAYSQYFWEAFPSGSGPTDRTTYMFTYLDAQPYRPSIQDVMEDYWKLMPDYQSTPIDEIQPIRILYGFFPTFKDSPLKPDVDRILQIGDASGIQSPLSFGGFGSMTRHLPRLTAAVTDALKYECLDKDNLSYINYYNPGISSQWMLQRAMSLHPDQKYDTQFVNTLLSNNFKTMQKFGDPVLKPFLQDVMQFTPMAKTLATQMASQPWFIPLILSQVGVVPLLNWLRHYTSLGLFTLGYYILQLLERQNLEALPNDLKFKTRRTIEGFKYGAGMDYHFE